MMKDPPILPDGSQDDQPAVPPNRMQNPYAPTVAQPTAKAAQSVDLPPAYWAVLLVAFGGFALLSYLAVGLGVPALFALLSAAIRVPLLQLRSPTTSIADRPSPLIMLLTSWGLSLIGGVASVIAFCATCLPLGFLAAVADQRLGMLLVIGLSVLVAGVIYILLFRLSLRLHL